MFFQSTIKRKIELSGIGLHTGKESKVEITPAPVGTGIIFISESNGKSYIIKASLDNLLCTNNAITISDNNFEVKTIEHFMASFYALNISNLYIKVSGSEMPIFDGSSKIIVESIENAGIEMQNAFDNIFYLPYPVWIEGKDNYLIGLPDDNFKVTYTVDFNSKSRAIGTQTAHFIIDDENFKRCIAPARTFGFLEDAEQLNANKLALGGSLDNVLVYTKDRLINGDLRFANECVRHKILDLIGDLSLLGCKLRGHFIAYKSGHSMDIKLAQKINKAVVRNRASRGFTMKIKSEFKSFRRRINL